MTKRKPDAKELIEAKTSVLGINDLIDFHFKWPILRKKVIDISLDANLSAEARELIDWLLKLSDRVGVKDLEETR